VPYVEPVGGVLIFVISELLPVEVAQLLLNDTQSLCKEQCPNSVFVKLRLCPEIVLNSLCYQWFANS